MLTNVLRLSSDGPSDASRRGGVPGRTPEPEQQADLPYRVELWDKTLGSVEQVLAVTANASIGYAAYFAATRDFPDRHITLRFRNAILSRWNWPSQ